MKAILMSIRPRHTCNILNDIKWWEIRKKFPKDYIGWVYIHCTKQDSLIKLHSGYVHNKYVCEKEFNINDFPKMYSGYDGKGKVVARFWCDKVEEMYYCDEEYLIPSCLTIHEMFDYLKDKNGYAIHITKLEIFDEPKEISEFKSCLLGHNNCVPHNCQECPATKPLTRAPQSWCYIED